MKNQSITQKSVALIFIINVMFATQTKSQNLTWDKSYADNNNECHGYSIKPVPGGGYIVCGSAFTDTNGKDIYLLRTDENGDTLWTKRIGGSDDEEGYCVAVCIDGGFIIAGYTGSYGNGAFDFFLVKTNSSGVTQWTETNGDALDEGSYSVIQTLDSGFIAVGYTYSEGEGGSDVKATKFDKVGHLIWSKTYGTAYNDNGYSVCQMRDSSYVICGSTSRGTSDSLDIYVIKIEADGDTLWTSIYAHNGYDCAYSVFPCLETGFVIAGKTNLNDSANSDMLFMRIFDDGSHVFTQTYGSAHYDEVAYDVKETVTNGFVLVGTTDANSQGTDGYVVHTDDHGDLLEETYYGAEDEDDFRSVCMKNDNTFAVTGTITNTLSLAEYYNCRTVLPRTLWYQDCWQFNSNEDNGKRRKSLFIDDDIMTAATKREQLVAYCKGARIHTIVLGRMEDIIREDNNTMAFSDYPHDTSACVNAANGDSLRTLLFNLIDSLHIAGSVNVVLAQWREENKEDGKKYEDVCSGWHYPYDEDTIGVKHNLEILNGFKLMNNGQTKSKQFDGIMMDYEYFTPRYGNATDTTNYRYALPGFLQWKIFADSLIAARGKNGIKFLQAYLARVVFTAKQVRDSNYFNYLGIWDVGDDSTSIEDSKAELWYIDSLGFNKLSIAFFVDDRTQDSS